MRVAATLIAAWFVTDTAWSQDPDPVPFAGRSAFEACAFETPPILAARTGAAADDVYRLPIQALGDVTGRVVADVGAGRGRHLEGLAQHVGPEGTLIATEITETGVARLQSLVTDAGLPNARVVQTPKDEVRLPIDSVDVVLLSDVYQFVTLLDGRSGQDKHGFLTSLHRALAPGGEVIVTYVTSSELRQEASSQRLIERTRTDFRDYGFEIGRHWILEGPHWPVAVLEFRSPTTGPVQLDTHMGREIAKTMHWRGAGWLVRAEREREENSARMLEALEVQPGWTVADFGCGNGYHTLELARMIDDGTVYGVDIQPEMLKLLEQRAERAELTNVKPLLGSQLDAPLPDGSCDLVLLADVYHELSNPVATLAAIRRSLKNGGRVAALEFRTEDPDVPIKPEHKMTRKQVIAEFEAAGFQLDGEFDELPWQHLLFFAPATVEGR